MTHLGFIIAAYAIAVAVPGTFALHAAQRLARARRLLAAVDHRAVR